MIKLFQSFLGIINTIVSLITEFIQSVLLVMGKIPAFFKFLTDSISILPGIFVPFILAGISLSVVLFIVRRFQS